MRDSIYLAWRYLSFHKIKSLVLILSVALIVFLPTGLKLLVQQGGESLTKRAEATPLIVGAKGSPLELTMNSLYFDTESPEAVEYAEALRIRETGFAEAIPLYTRFQSQGLPIVGTSLEYFDFRNLTLKDGRVMATMGECVIGSEVAEELDVKVGGSLVSSPESVFDLAGVYPLKMRVVGVFEPSGTADDHAIFTDLKTAWVIQGLAHGHVDMQSEQAASAVLKREGKQVVANASVKTYNEITPENVHAFHFHGAMADFPISSVIAVPHDAKSATMLRGRYVDKKSMIQVVQPSMVMNELLETISTVQKFVFIGLLVAGVSAAMTMILVFVLSFQLRKREMLTMNRIGAAPRTVLTLLGLEIGFILVIGTLIAAALSTLVALYGAEFIQNFII